MQRIYANRRSAQEAGLNPNVGTRHALLDALLESSSNTARTLPQETQNNYRNQQAQQELRNAERDYNLVADALAGTSIGQEAQSRIADARRDVSRMERQNTYPAGSYSVTESQRRQWYEDDRENARERLPELQRGLLDWEADYGLSQEALAGTETGRENRSATGSTLSVTGWKPWTSTQSVNTRITSAVSSPPIMPSADLDRTNPSRGLHT